MPFWNWKKKEPKGQSAQSLSDIARGMQHAVNSTQELTEQHYQEILERYFDDNGAALTKRFQLPDGTVMDVPLISLVPSAGLKLEEMIIEMSVKIDHSDLKSAHPDKETLTRASFQCSFAHRRGDTDLEQDVIEISMKFVAGDPPEGVAKLMEYYTNTALPKLPKKGQPGPARIEMPADAQPKPDATPPA
jgi:hypothetical protein